MLSLLWISFYAAPALAFSPEAAFLGGGSPASISIEHQRVSAPETGLRSRVDEQKVSFSAPILRSENGSLALIGGMNRTELGEAFRFSDRAVSIPKVFQTNQVGLAWQHKGASQRRYGVSGTYGRAGPKFWSSDGDAILSLNASLEVPLENGNSWLYFLNYSNNRSILNNIPLPGIAYSINGGSYRLILGLPFAFALYRAGKFTATALLSPFTAFSELGYRIWGPIQAYGGASWSPKTYQNLVPASEDRLIFIQKELGAGVRFYFNREASISVGYVRALDRRFVLGKSRTKTSSEPVHLGDADGFQAKVRFSF